jgi:hypothetical protein
MAADTLRALTLWQPWAYAVAHLGKDVENRTWKPWPSVIGTRIAIHAAAKVDQVAERDAAGFICHRTTGVLPLHLDLPRAAIVATARVTGVVTESADPWFVGPYGWKLDEVIALPTPVPCRGAQGLWIVPPDVAAQVFEQVKSATTAQKETTR